MDIRPLDDHASAAPQIDPSDLPAIRDAGYRLVVNNRPDGEEPGQPSGADVEAAAREAGLDYAAIPVGRQPLTQADIEALRQALSAAPGPALLYCRSGTRSTTLWALAEAAGGRDPDDIVARAAAAGYDLSAQAPVLRQLAGR